MSFGITFVNQTSGSATFELTLVRVLASNQSLSVASAAAAAASAAAAAASETQTGLDAVATAADRVQTGLDAVATAADRVQTGLDAVATAADRVQTGLDAVSTAADAVATAADRAVVEGAAWYLGGYDAMDIPFASSSNASKIAFQFSGRKEADTFFAGTGERIISDGAEWTPLLRDDPLPILELDFSSAKHLPTATGKQITFSRAGHATVIDSTGKITFPPNNVFTYSNDLTNAAWTKSGTTASGINTLTESSSTADHYITRSVTPSAPSRYTEQFKVEANGRSAIYITASYSGTTNWVGKSFNLSSVSAGSVQTGAGSPPTYVNATIEATETAGEYLVSLTVDINAATSFHIGLSDVSAPTLDATNGRYSYLGDGVQGIYIRDAQLERVWYETTPRAFNSTVASAYYGPRFDHDPVTLASKGIQVEAARTNLCLWTNPRAVTDYATRAGLVSFASSVDFNIFTSNAIAIGYDGATTSAAYNLIATTATTYVVSAYVKMDDGLSPAFGSATATSVTNDFAIVVEGAAINPATYQIQSIGGGVYRVYGSATTTGSGNCGIVKYNTNSSRTFKFTAMQCTTGTVPSSLIPTGASAVARPAESYYMTGSDFTTWFNASEGTIVVKGAFDSGAGTSSTYIAAFNDNTSSNYITAFGSTASISSIFMNTSSVLQVGSTAVVTGTSSPFKLAFAYKQNDSAGTINGAPPYTDTSCSIPTVDRLFIGGFSTSSQMNGHIYNLAYYDRRLSDAELQEVTA